jgi:hypothetical protein
MAGGEVQLVDLVKRFGVIENQQVLREFFGLIKPDLPEAIFNLADRWRIQAGPCQHDAERIDVAAERNATEQRGLD